MTKYTVTYESFNNCGGISGYSVAVSAVSGPEAVKVVLSHDSAAFNLHAIERIG